MTDLELAAKKIAEIETYIGELRALARPDQISTDLRERRFAEHTVQLAIQACLDVSSHIASDERLGEPETYAELFSLLAGRGYIPAELATRLRRMAGFRNLLVHNYARVDPKVVAGIVTHDVGHASHPAVCVIAVGLRTRARLPGAYALGSGPAFVEPRWLQFDVLRRLGADRGAQA